MLISLVISLLLGSFYNVVALRSLKGENIALGRSYCVHCNQTLSFIDMFPLISFIFLRGRCRFCKGQISFLYPFGELINCISYSLIIYLFGLNLYSLVKLVLSGILNISTITDLKEKIIPNKIIVVGFIGVIILRLYIKKDLAYYIFSSIVLFISLYIIYRHNLIGGGDVKLYALIGLSIGLKYSLYSLVFASWLGVIYILVKILGNKFKRQDEIAFVPFINMGVILVYILEQSSLY